MSRPTRLHFPLNLLYGQEPRPADASKHREYQSYFDTTTCARAR